MTPPISTSTIRTWARWEGNILQHLDYPATIHRTFKPTDFPSSDIMEKIADLPGFDESQIIMSRCLEAFISETMSMGGFSLVVVWVTAFTNRTMYPVIRAKSSGSVSKVNTLNFKSCIRLQKFTYYKSNQTFVVPPGKTNMCGYATTAEIIGQVRECPGLLTSNTTSIDVRPRNFGPIPSDEDDARAGITSSSYHVTLKDFGVNHPLYTVGVQSH
ncbi:hypothetical protein TNCV_4070201 [Trichonephila clavipes]|nr:hypothetical protein TNCV_4070201 [Trichonephila clavipes]